MYCVEIWSDEREDDFDAIAKGGTVFEDGEQVKFIAFFSSKEKVESFAKKHAISSFVPKPVSRKLFREFLLQFREYGYDYVGFDADAGQGLVFPISIFNV
jgi:hypothetical protein